MNQNQRPQSSGLGVLVLGLLCILLVLFVAPIALALLPVVLLIGVIIWLSEPKPRQLPWKGAGIEYSAVIVLFVLLLFLSTISRNAHPLVLLAVVLAMMGGSFWLMKKG
ncbi:MAG: hypothetical protein LH702_02085 [Phormidesmis sp. CAN_BIN44]|nr:hypothetical protein [Phormidesmis sp. CAN_BIN44]